MECSEWLRKEVLVLILQLLKSHGGDVPPSGLYDGDAKRWSTASELCGDRREHLARRVEILHTTSEEE